MVVGTDNFGGEPQLVRGRRHERQVRAKCCGCRDADLCARREKARAENVGDAGFDDGMQPQANQFVPRAGSFTRREGAVKDFFVGLAHAAGRILRRKRPVCDCLLRGLLGGLARLSYSP